MYVLVSNDQDLVGGSGMACTLLSYTKRLQPKMQPLCSLPFYQGSKLTFKCTCKALLERFFSTSKLVRPLANYFPLFGRHG